jgi:hypothetical protein
MVVAHRHPSAYPNGQGTSFSPLPDSGRELDRKCYKSPAVPNGLQYGCGMGRLHCSAGPHVLPANRNKIESRRADSNR